MSPLPVLLKTRLKLLFARLLLVCINRVLRQPRAPVRDDASDAIEEPHEDNSSESLAIRVLQFSRRRYSKGRSYCRDRVRQIRQERKIKADRAQFELQSVLEEVRSGWQTVSEHVAQIERRDPVKKHPAIVSQPASPDSPSAEPRWMAEAMARSRIALNRPASREPEPESSTPAEIEPNTARQAEQATINETPSTSARVPYAGQSPAAISTNAFDDFANGSTVRAADAEASPVDPPVPYGRKQTGNPGISSEKARSDGYSEGASVSSPPYLPSARTVASADVHADAGPPRLAEQQNEKGAPSSLPHAARRPGFWPSLPDESETLQSDINQTPTNLLANADDGERQRILEQEQRGEPWSA